jgi:hypothetical protein
VDSSTKPVGDTGAKTVAKPAAEGSAAAPPKKPCDPFANQHDCQH